MRTTNLSLMQKLYRGLLLPILKLLPINYFRNPPAKVAVLPLHGVIGGGRKYPAAMMLSAAASKEAIDRAFNIPDVKAVVISVNSPGGSPVQSALIYNQIRSLSQTRNIPVIAFAEDVCASGGYWVACAADEIFADRSSIIGSIGVIAAGFGFVELLKRFGIERRVYTEGDNKNVLDPFLPEKAEDIAKIKSVQADIHDNFKKIVNERRAGRLKGEESELFNGSFWVARQAEELGLIDGIAEMQSFLEERYGKDVKILRVEQPKSWIARKLSIGNAAAYGPEDWVHAALNEMEARSQWGRFGL